MFTEQEDLMYYITVTNETYRMPEKPDNAEEGILKGMYKLKSSGNKTPKVRLLASGALVNEALRAKELLLGDYDIPAEVWSVTSFKELYTDCTDTERRNMLESGGREQKNYIRESFEGSDTVYVAATDYLKALPLSVSKWLPGESAVLGTDGFGRSDNRGALRDYFEVDYRHMTAAALSLLVKKGELKKETVKKAWKDLENDPEKMNPADL